ncbi:MAG: hypothetical protein JWM53_2513 [bacterium]|nr:hypothetical protein [bacterium]
MLRIVLVLSVLIVACAGSDKKVKSAAGIIGPPQGAIHIAMEKIRPMASACVRRTQNEGRIWDVKMIIGADGKLEDVTLINAEDHDGEVAQCVLAQVSSLVFPRSRSRTTVVYPYYLW